MPHLPGEQDIDPVPVCQESNSLVLLGVAHKAQNDDGRLLALQHWEETGSATYV